VRGARLLRHGRRAATAPGAVRAGEGEYVFNLGATLYWCITGRHIPTLYTVNKKGENSFLLDATIKSPIDLNPRVPLAVSNLVMECIATKPAKRPQDMDQVLSRLELGKHILEKAANPDPFVRMK